MLALALEETRALHEGVRETKAPPQTVCVVNFTLILFPGVLRPKMPSHRRGVSFSVFLRGGDGFTTKEVKPTEVGIMPQDLRSFIKS